MFEKKVESIRLVNQLVDEFVVQVDNGRRPRVKAFRSRLVQLRDSGDITSTDCRRGCQWLRMESSEPKSGGRAAIGVSISISAAILLMFFLATAHEREETQAALELPTLVTISADPGDVVHAYDLTLAPEFRSVIDLSKPRDLEPGNYLIRITSADGSIREIVREIPTAEEIRDRDWLPLNMRFKIIRRFKVADGKIAIAPPLPVTPIENRLFYPPGTRLPFDQAALLAERCGCRLPYTWEIDEPTKYWCMDSEVDRLEIRLYYFVPCGGTLRPLATEIAQRPADTT